MDSKKIIRQTMKLLGINRDDIDVSVNHYYKNLVEELEDMRNQILEEFDFQVKIVNNLGMLPIENYPSIRVDYNDLYAHTLPTDFLSYRSSNSELDEYIRIKGNVIYMPQGIHSLEYYSSETPYEDFPAYTEKYVVFCLAQRVSIFLGRDGTQYYQLSEMEKQSIKDKERRNTGFKYSSNTLVRR